MTDITDEAASDGQPEDKWNGIIHQKGSPSTEGEIISRIDFEMALSRAATGEPLTDTGTDFFDVALHDVANSAPGSDARADAIEVARLVFAQFDPVAGDGIPWSGSSCPSCYIEMNVDIMLTSRGLKEYQRCPQCSLVLLVPDLFEE